MIPPKLKFESRKLADIQGIGIDLVLRSVWNIAVAGALVEARDLFRECAVDGGDGFLARVDVLIGEVVSAASEDRHRLMGHETKVAGL